MRLPVGGAARRDCRPGRLWPGSVVFAVALWLGVLASFASPVAAGAAGSVYVTITNQSRPGAVSQYAIIAGGLLSPLTPPTVYAGTTPAGVAVAPDGKSVYVTGGQSPTPRRARSPSTALTL
jgi:hypothetical protein